MAQASVHTDSRSVTSDQFDEIASAINARDLKKVKEIVNATPEIVDSQSEVCWEDVCQTQMSLEC